MNTRPRIRVGTGPIFSDRTGPTGLAFSTGPDRPVQTLDFTGRKPVKNRPVTIHDFTGVKLAHLMYELNSQHFRETMFYFSLKMIYTVKLILFLNSLIVTARILVCHISCANIKRKRRFLSESFDFFQ